MATLIIRPTANGDTMNWTSEGGDYTRVDDTTSDGDTTRLYTPTDNVVGLFGLTNHGSESGTINFVTVYIVIRGLDPVSQGTQVGVKMGGTEYWSSTKTWNSTTYTTLSETWTTNPNTSSAWTWTNIDDLQAGMKRISGGGQAVTMVYVEIDYGTPTIEQEGFRWRNDDGSESTATWIAAQDTNITREKGQNTRLRILLNASDDPSTTQYRLDHKLSTDGVWTAVPSTDGGTIDVTNYVVNPSFENNITDGCGSFGSGVTNSRVTTEFKFGSACYQCFAASPTDGGLIISNISLPAGTYYASAWVKTGANVTNACTVLRTGSQVFESHITSANQDWQRVSGSFTLGSTTNVEWVVGLGAYGSTSQGTAWWDGFMITATSLYDYFDGDTADTSAYTYEWTSTAHNSYPRRRIKPDIHYTPSSNITASGEATTAQLTAPSGKTTSDFDAGRIQDDENPADTVDITTDDYTEMEWNLIASDNASNGEIWQFRISKNGTALDTYTLIPEWTIGTPSSNVSSGTLSAPIYPLWKTPVNSLSDFTSLATATGETVSIVSSGFLGNGLSVNQNNSASSEVGVRIENAHLKKAKRFEYWTKIRHGAAFTGEIAATHAWYDTAGSAYGGDLAEIRFTPISVTSGYAGNIILRSMSGTASAVGATQLDLGTWNKVVLNVKPSHMELWVNRGTSREAMVSHASIANLELGALAVGKYYAQGLNGSMYFDNFALRSTPTGTPSTVGGRLSDTYDGWLQRYLAFEGGVVRPYDEGNNDTPNYAASSDIVSEGQAYGMLYAVHHNDKDTFDLIENFNRSVLERTNFPSSTASLRAQGAHLMGWHYNAHNSNASGPNSMYDWNFATDADIDRAKALMYAHVRWGRTSGASIAYLSRAKEILDDLKVWGHNSVSGIRYMGADFLSLNDTTAETNVSYFDMTTFRLARQLFSDQFWDQSINGMYEIIRKSTSSTGSLMTNWGLPPNWINWNTTNLTAQLPNGGRDTNYSYDAFRTVYRMYLDYDFYQEKQARDLLSGQLYTSFASEWNRAGVIKAEYSHAGAVTGDYEGSMFYSVNMFPFFVAGATVAGATIYNNKVLVAYRENPAGSYWSDVASSSGGTPKYFQDSWTQFSVAAKERFYPQWGMWRDTASQLW